MQKLDKKSVAERERLCDLMRQIIERGNMLIEDYNESLDEDDLQKVEQVVTALNEQIDAANEFIQDQHEMMDSYYNDRSESWQEGDRGQAYQGWMDEWDVSLESVELGMNEDRTLLELDDSIVDELENLPDAVSY